MSDRTTLTQRIFQEIWGAIEIPESAYEKAEARYRDLGDWFNRPEARCFDFDPHIYAQGSFRLGTVVHSDEFDLDMGCRLRRGVTKATHTQKALKKLVQVDLEAYRQARGIKSDLEEKARCWRLPYADTLRFHLDAVPSIPEEDHEKQVIRAAMAREGTPWELAHEVSQWAGAISDNRRQDYNVISLQWLISNSEGFAKWFESRMKLAEALMASRAFLANRAQVDDLPARTWKSPLQFAVQVLKHHRNVMFADNPDSKPISVILTTLAAHAYQGEPDVENALHRILADMGNYVRAAKPRVPNPVNPDEDFADKWGAPQFRHLQLEHNFRLWLRQAQSDFKILGESRDADFLSEALQAKLAVNVEPRILKNRLGFGAAHVVTTPKHHQLPQNPPKPWRRD